MSECTCRGVWMPLVELQEMARKYGFGDPVRHDDLRRYTVAFAGVDFNAHFEEES